MRTAATLFASSVALAAADITMVTFDGAAGTTHKFVELNDPVMGGRSTGTWSVNATGQFGVLDGEVVNVPKLKAPGFITAAADGKFVDVSSAIGGDLVLEVRTSTPEFEGFRASFASGTLAPAYACAGGGSLPLSGGCFKAPFHVPAGDKWTSVRIPFSSFSDHWSPETGNITKTCASDPSVCVTAKKLSEIVRMEVWGEGFDGKLHLEVKSISAAPPTVCKNTEYCCPDAKHCLTPTKVSCAKDANVCEKGQACCPITKLCVDVGAPCTSPCADQGSYCCPDALHCLTPTNPGTLCTGAKDCGSNEVCCPITHECVAVGAACVPP